MRNLFVLGLATLCFGDAMYGWFPEPDKNEQYILEKVSEYALARWLNHYVRPPARILVLGSSDVAYLYWDPGLRMIRPSGSPEDVSMHRENDPRAWLAKHGITHVVLCKRFYKKQASGWMQHVDVIWGKTEENEGWQDLYWDFDLIKSKGKFKRILFSQTWDVYEVENGQ